MKSKKTKNNHKNAPQVVDTPEKSKASFTPSEFLAKAQMKDQAFDEALKNIPEDNLISEDDHEGHRQIASVISTMLYSLMCDDLVDIFIRYKGPQETNDFVPPGVSKIVGLNIEDQRLLGLALEHCKE